MRISFRIKLLASHAAVAIAASAVTLLVAERAVSRHMESQINTRLQDQAQAVAKWLRRGRHADKLAGRLARVVGGDKARVTIFANDGTVLGDSIPVAERVPADEDAGPEVSAALSHDIGYATRRSSVGDVRYVAVLAEQSRVVRVGLAIGAIDKIKSDIRRQLGTGALASLLVALGLAAFVAGPLTRRLRGARDLAHRIAAGDYEVDVVTSSSDEIGVLARALSSAAHELKETDARRREFLANVAHEIRTPVTSIRGYTETLASTDVDKETQNEFLHTIHRNSLRIGQLVDDLLELEALEAGKGRALACEPVAVESVVDNVIATVSARSTKQGATVSKDIAPGLSITGDADALERIVLNLVANALQHGGANVQVTIIGRIRGDRVALRVRDNGPGVAPADRARIFDRFQSAAATARGGEGGTGLGLAIARELAQASGGTLVLEDTQGKGAEFVLEV